MKVVEFLLHHDIYICVHVYVCVHIHTGAHTHAHTHTWLYIDCLRILSHLLHLYFPRKCSLVKVTSTFSKQKEHKNFITNFLMKLSSVDIKMQVLHAHATIFHPFPIMMHYILWSVTRNKPFLRL